ncbi:MAG: hypothetical protein Q7J11_01585, partial [Candidatus Roizmanbacteria bacterium]|nr:hypothetical protein [Candidatus Roizmanbacteria bacterium]
MERFCRVILFVMFFFIAIHFLNVQAADCVIGQNLSGKSEPELNEIINKCEAKKNELNKQANTLFTQIQYMDTQIYLTGLQINETEQKITNTEKEIGLLGSRIEGLDQSLDYLSKQLIK